MEWVGLLLFVAIIASFSVWAYRRYQRHAQAASDLSMAALNQLLREADEIEQAKLRELGIEPEQEPEDPLAT